MNLPTFNLFYKPYFILFLANWQVSVTIKKGTTIKELANTLEEYGIISDTTVFRVQAYVYNTKSIKAGQYTFNTSQNAEELFNKIKEGPEKTKSTKSTKTKAKSKSDK